MSSRLSTKRDPLLRMSGLANDVSGFSKDVSAGVGGRP
jgi:hypothetical protein